MHLSYHFLYAILPLSGVFIVIARILKYIQYFTSKKGGDA